MLQRLACLFVLLASSQCVVCSSNASTIEGSACTNGFTSKETLKAWSETGNANYFHWRQWLFPNINFTCSGRITKWIVAGQYHRQRRSSPQHPRLQVWRSGVNPDEFDVVGYTELDFIGYNSRKIYEYQLDYPIQFEAGDVFGLYDPFQGFTNLNIFFESTASDVQRESLFVYQADRPFTTFTIASMFVPPTSYETRQDVRPIVAVEVETAEENATCTSGFMPLERLELIAPIQRQGQQQVIIPDMNITCNGSITNWTVAGRYNSDTYFTRFPEIQIWRKVSTDTDSTQHYIKAETIVLSAPVENPNRLYTGEVNPPVEVRPGDILGLYLPVFNQIRMEIYFEETDDGPTNYVMYSPMLQNLNEFMVTGITSQAQRRPYIALDVMIPLDRITTSSISIHSTIAPTQSTTTSSVSLPETQPLMGTHSIATTSSISIHSSIAPTQSTTTSSISLPETQPLMGTHSIATQDVQMLESNTAMESLVHSHMIEQTAASSLKFSPQLGSRTVTSTQDTYISKTTSQSVSSTSEDISTYTMRSYETSSHKELTIIQKTSSIAATPVPLPTTVSTTLLGPIPEDTAQKSPTFLIIVVSTSVGFILIITIIAVLVFITALKVAAPKRVYKTSERVRKGSLKWNQPGQQAVTITLHENGTAIHANGTDPATNTSSENITQPNRPLRDEANDNTHTSRENTQHALDTASPVTRDSNTAPQSTGELPIIVTVASDHENLENDRRNEEEAGTAECNTQSVEEAHDEAEFHDGSITSMPNDATEMEEDLKKDLSL